ncbi:MAG: cytochrome P460 family protein, partial [Candidatus Sulfotelmatobacter sp.]
MKRSLAVVLVLVACLALLAAAPEAQSPQPQYDAKGNLLRPADYRDWEFLSAGFGMNYSATAGHEMFTNVFVQRWAYEQFLGSGKWPEQTMFVIDERAAQSKGSINKTGHFQTDLMGLAVEVKDSSHNPE